MTAIAEAVQARYERLRTISSAKAIAMLNLRGGCGSTASPRYLHGVHASWSKLNDHNSECLRAPTHRGL